MEATFLDPMIADGLHLPRMRVSIAGAQLPRSTDFEAPQPVAGRRCVLIQCADRSQRLVEVELSAGEYALVEIVIVWRHWVVVGCGHGLHFIEPIAARTRSHNLGSYFCDVFAAEDRLVASSAERVFCLDAAAQLRWRSDPIAVDGINLYRVESGTVQGSAERDPPGGWVSFAVDLVTGKNVAPPQLG